MASEKKVYFDKTVAAGAMTRMYVTRGDLARVLEHKGGWANVASIGELKSTAGRVATATIPIAEVI